MNAYLNEINQVDIAETLKKSIDDLINNSSGTFALSKIKIAADILLTCAEDEPEIFKAFVKANPEVTRLLSKYYGTNENALQNISNTIDSGGDVHAALLENVDNERLMGAAVYSALGSSVEAIYDLGINIGVLLGSEGDEQAEQLKDDLKEMLLYISEHPEEITEELKASLEKFGTNLKNGDPFAFGTLIAGGLEAIVPAGLISKIKFVKIKVTNTTVIGGKTCVYTCVVNGTTRYVGITDDVARRGAEHLSQKGIEIEGIRGLSNISRADARAVEQTLINYYGLGKVEGGSLLNKINSISPTKNPTAYEQSLIRGKELLDRVDYQWTN